jgi:alanine-glyoxylate transaminase/serine-glyoxylate transaminase/serine-pyruvate transaminase
VWRIGLMGHNARPDAVLLVLAALRDALDHA